TRVAPALEPRFAPLDRVGRLFFDGVAVGHPDRRLEYLAETQFSVLGEHRHEAAGRAGGDGGERAVLGREAAAPGSGRGRRRSGGRDAEGVDRDEMLGVRVEEPRLRWAVPG